MEVKVEVNGKGTKWDICDTKRWAMQLLPYTYIHDVGLGSVFGPLYNFFILLGLDAYCEPCFTACNSAWQNGAVPHAIG